MLNFSVEAERMRFNDVFSFNLMFRVIYDLRQACNNFVLNTDRCYLYHLHHRNVQNTTKNQYFTDDGDSMKYIGVLPLLSFRLAVPVQQYDPAIAAVEV